MSSPSMPSIDIRHLRDPRRLKALLGEGKTVELREGHRLFARIVSGRQRLPKHWPNFARRRRCIFGDRILSGAKLVVVELGRY